jgi:hypothetical protein
VTTGEALRPGDGAESGRPNRQQERSRRSTRALLDAAAELIVEGGFESLTLAAIGERAGRMRRDSGERDDGRHGPRVSRLIRAALENLREVAAERLKDDADAEAKLVEVLARAAAELRKA